MKIKIDLSNEEAEEFIFQVILGMIGRYSGESDEIDIDIKIHADVV